MKNFKTVPITARLLSPYYYGHIAVQGGVSTIPDVIPDRALCFGIAAALGALNQRPVMFPKNYKEHLGQIPWKASVLYTETPRLMSPIAKRFDMSAEGGRQDFIRRATGSGNVKEYWSIQEVPQDTVFVGCLFGADPFEISGLEKITVRIGNTRSGLLCLEKRDVVDPSKDMVRLNLCTARLFDSGHDIPMDRYLLNELQLSIPLSLQDATNEVSKWA